MSMPAQKRIARNKRSGFPLSSFESKRALEEMGLFLQGSSRSLVLHPLCINPGWDRFRGLHLCKMWETHHLKEDMFLVYLINRKKSLPSTFCDLNSYQFLLAFICVFVHKCQ